MSNRLRVTSDHGLMACGGSWRYVYGLSADARTDSARLKQIDWIHRRRRSQRARLEQKRMADDAYASLEAYIGRKMDALRSEGWKNVRYVDGVIRGDTPKPKRSLVEVVDKLMTIGFYAGLTVLLLAWLAWFIGLVLG